MKISIKDKKISSVFVFFIFFIVEFKNFKSCFLEIRKKKLVEKEKPLPNNPNERRERIITDFKERKELENKIQKEA